MKKNIVVVGSIALDTVKTPYGEVSEVLGGSATYFSTAASYFTKVRMVAVVGTDFPKEHIAFLKSRRIDIRGLARVQGKTFRWKGQYGNDINEAETLDTQLNVFETFSPSLPPAYRNSPYVFLANIDPQLQDEVLNQVSSVSAPQLVVCDTMNLWIDIKKEALEKVLKRVHIFIINESEAKQFTGENNLIKAARSILAKGPKTVIIKRGEYGALCVSSLLSKTFAIPSYPLEQVCDSTGAGDSFAGGFFGCLVKKGKLNEKTLKQSIVYGNTLGSFCVEGFSLDRYKTLTYEDIKSRYKEFKHLTSF